MRVLALDLSSKTGWAHFEQNGTERKLVETGLIQLDRPILDFYKEYPWNYYRAAGWQGLNINDLVKRVDPEVIVIEETNEGRNRYTQKFLEFVHCRVLEQPYVNSHRVVYINSGTWRSKLGLKLSSMDRRMNKLLREAKKIAKAKGDKMDAKFFEKYGGRKGSKNKKHLAIEYANKAYGLQLKVKDNDIADAICLGTAFLEGAEICDGRRD